MPLFKTNTAFVNRPPPANPASVLFEKAGPKQIQFEPQVWENQKNLGRVSLDFGKNFETPLEFFITDTLNSFAENSQSIVVVKENAV